MLKFYKKRSDTFSRQIERKLEDMVVAHKVISVGQATKLPNNISRDSLPVLTDNHEVWKSEAEIDNFLEALHQELTLGRQRQSDSCYIDPDNPDQCL